MAKRKKSKKQNSQSKAKRAFKRYQRNIPKYENKIEAINDIINGYFQIFGSTGKDYTSIISTVEKVLGDEFSVFLIYGDGKSSVKVSKHLANTIKRKGKYRTTRLYTTLSKLESPIEYGARKYGLSLRDPHLAERLKAYSALEKLQSDAVPNYYKAIDAISTTDKQMSFRKEFSDLHQYKRGTQEYDEEYSKIADSIKKYLEGIVGNAEDVMESIDANKESVYGEFTPSYVKDLLKDKLF